MNASATRRLVQQMSIGVLLTCPTSCIESVRVPLAVPLPSVGGTRPATPQGIEFLGEFGDGVWGQEQERAEMAGGGIGFALQERVEVTTSTYTSTRSVRTESGDDHTGESTSGFRGKMRIFDLGARASLGVHVGHMSAQRDRTDVQNDELTAWDIALPLEFYPKGRTFADYRLGLYIAPRLVAQRFEDRLTRESTKGRMVAALAGVAARWRYVALTGELNFARTPTMEFRDVTFPGGWILLPMGGIRGMIPIGD
jgi:hypothetical protein